MSTKFTPPEQCSTPQADRSGDLLGRALRTLKIAGWLTLFVLSMVGSGWVAVHLSWTQFIVMYLVIILGAAWWLAKSAP